MNRVYVLVIENYDALDDYMTSIDIKVFSDRTIAQKWMKHEATHQALNGFKVVAGDSNSDHWEFDKETIHGSYRNIFNGWYHEIIGEEQ